MSTLKRHGGKHYLARPIRQLQPPHVHFVDAYCGSAAVLFASDGVGVSEVINDLDGPLTLFWTVLSTPSLFACLKDRCEQTPFSETFYGWAEEVLAAWDRNELPKDAHSTIEVAWAFFTVCRQSRQGLMNDFATLTKRRTRRGMNEQVSAWLTAIEGLPAVHERLKRVVVLNKPAVQVIRSEDTEQTWFYLDPPYVPSTRTVPNAYRHEMTYEQHEELLGMLVGIKGKFSLSGYRCDLYDAYASECGWWRADIEIDNKSSSDAVKEIKTESIWMNYQPVPPADSSICCIKC